MNLFKRTYFTTASAIFFIAITAAAQNPKLKCYFNHPVNNALSTGTNAIYLNGTFPDTVVAYINNAKYTLDFAVYDFTSVAGDTVSKIATAVNNAYLRGVTVRWINNGSSSNKGMSLLNASIPRISSPTSSGYGIMHNKFLIVDANSSDSNDAYVISGSYNYSVEQTNEDYNNIVIIQNQQVATAYYNQFNQMWGGTGPTPNTATSAFGTHKVTSPTHYFNVNGIPVDIHFSPKDTCGTYLTKVANSANNDLTFGIYTFTDNSIAQAILSAYDNKVTVRGIEDVSSQTFAPYTTLSSPLGNNFVVYNGGANSLYHNKIMIVDALLPSSDPQVATGSFNWTSSAEKLNDENLIVIHDPTIANEYYQSVCENITVNGGNACILPLPVDWVSLSASLGGNNTATINWATANEMNINHFEVQRSNDGASFEKIGVVNYIHSSKNQFVDANIYQVTNFYRIKEVDNDGGFTFSKVVGLYNRTKNTLSIYPNPAVNQLNVLLPTDAKELAIYNALGKKLLQKNVCLIPSISIDVTNFEKGYYYIEVIGEGDKMINSFIKE
jgi:phosphatidylserine/phosphatidylglycerophosphate/cardiolipin synthase-like enzyme